MNGKIYVCVLSYDEAAKLGAEDAYRESNRKNAALPRRTGALKNVCWFWTLRSCGRVIGQLTARCFTARKIQGMKWSEYS